MGHLLNVEAKMCTFTQDIQHGLLYGLIVRICICMYKDTKVSGACVPGRRFQDMFSGIVHSSATPPILACVYTIYIVHTLLYIM